MVERMHRAPMPSCGESINNCLYRVSSLDLDVELTARIDELEHLVKRRGCGILRTKLSERERRDRNPFHGWIMMNHRNAVACMLNVQLDSLDAEFDGQFEGLERVFRRLPIRPPVRYDRDSQDVLPVRVLAPDGGCRRAHLVGQVAGWQQAPLQEPLCPLTTCANPRLTGRLRNGRGPDWPGRLPRQFAHTALE